MTSAGGRPIIGEVPLRQIASVRLPGMSRFFDDAAGSAALRRRDAVKTAILGAVSHDLRSPITAILTAAQGLSMAGLAEGDRFELASIVDEEGQRLARLVDRLLDLTRIDAGAAEPRRVWTSLAEVIDGAIDALDVPADAFVVDVAADVRLVLADPVQLERVFGNLLANATRYSGAERVRVNVRAFRDCVSVHVIDRGPGVPAAERERSFEPFYRCGAGTTSHRGAGLGLAIARAFVVANGGRIWVESLPGQTTSFVVVLPRSEGG